MNGDAHFAHRLFVTMNPAEMNLLSGHESSMISLPTASNRSGGSVQAQRMEQLNGTLMELADVRMDVIGKEKGGMPR